MYIEIPPDLVDEVNKRTRRQPEVILGSDKVIIERIVTRTKDYQGRKNK